MTEEEHKDPKRPGDWIDWPPSPRMQIVLIAGACALINLILILVWAIALYTR